MNVLDTLFGPVSKKYCVLFYYLSIWAFIIYVLAVFGAIAYGIKHHMGILYYIISLIMSMLYFVGYLQNRVLFSMCSH